MAKGDDSVRRKQNKKLRKRSNSKNDSATVSAKIAAVIASKKRRKAGKRRICEGMCFSLPTPEDPFNDRQGKAEFKTKDSGKKTRSSESEDEIVPVKDLEKKTRSPKDEMVPVNGKSASSRKGIVVGGKNVEVTQMPDLCGAQQLDDEDSEFPSKFVFWCLSAIESALRHGDAYTDGEANSLFLTPWGLEFSKCYSTDKDLLETSGTSATTEQIAWIVSAAADTFVRKEKELKEGLSVDSPFLLFLVPSSKKAVQVRTVCKPLKSMGIHTVSIHPDASLDHQIQGLKSCEPEFLVSTPERLLELVSMKAIDISSVSMLVIDGLKDICQAGLMDAINSIKKSISGNPRLVVFNDSFNHTSIPMVRYLLTGSISRLSLNNSITRLSSCIIQSVKVCTSEDKIAKSIEVLDQFRSSHTHSSNLLYILRKDAKCLKLVKTLKSKGCSTSDAANFNDGVDSKNRLEPVVSMIDLEHIFTADIGMFDVIVLPNFVPSMDTYVHILTKMARESVNGVLHSFLTKGDTELAGPLISILEQCGQEVPQTLQDLHDAHAVMSED